MIYDVFGIFVQTVRGADILASGYHETPDKGGEYKVFMPDWFGDNPADVSHYPPKTPKEVADTNWFMNGPANPAGTVPKIAPLMEAIKKANPQIESWAIQGFCWGGKIAALVSQEGSLFKAAGQAHPSLLERADASKVTIPMVVLPSLDEVPEVSFRIGNCDASHEVFLQTVGTSANSTALTQEVDPWIQDLKMVSTSSFSETFPDSVHGWMTSRFVSLHPRRQTMGNFAYILQN